MSTTEDRLDNVEDRPVITGAEGTAEAEPAVESARPKKVSGEVKLFIGILLGALVLGSAAILPTLLAKQPSTDPRPVPYDRSFLIPANSHIKGNPKAPYTLVEFSDFQCPSCKRAAPEIDKALEKHGDKLNVVFRHFQAAQRHMHSHALGVAAEAAGLQGKFYEMGDKLFENQDKYETATPAEVQKIIMKAASQLGLDMARFKADLTSPQVAERVDSDQAAGTTADVEGTPWFFFVPPQGKPTVLPKLTDMTWWVNNPKNYK